VESDGESDGLGPIVVDQRTTARPLVVMVNSFDCDAWKWGSGHGRASDPASERS
jgi:hypothetical protein